MTIINSVVFLFLQHVLIVVKLILAFVIPDEPDWVQIKRQQIEYYSMKALKKLVMCAITAPQYSASVCVQYSCLSLQPEMHFISTTFRESGNNNM